MQLPSGTYNTNYSKDMALVRTKTQWGLLIVFLLILFTCVPLCLNRYWLGVLIYIAIWIIAVHGLNILTGYCGIVSLGHAGFMAAGAYTVALLSTHFGIPFWATIPIAGLAAALIGMFFGLASLRIKGFYIAVATIAAQVIILYLIGAFPSITGGTIGLKVPEATLGGITLNNNRSYYFLAMGVAVLMTYLALNIAKGRVGRALVAIRDNDIAAESMGVGLFHYKTIAFAIGCFYAGIAGALMAYWLNYVSGAMFSFSDSIWLLGTLVIGGAGTTIGPIFGVIFVQALKEGALRIAPHLASAFPGLAVGITAGLAPVFFGLILVLFFVFEPRGLAHRWSLFKAYYRFYPFSS